MATDTPQSTAIDTATPQHGSTPILPTPTATHPLYTDHPFTIVFLRDGNLWISEVGGEGESQLTYEPEDWPVHWYAVSPEYDRVAYIPYRGPETADALIKIVRVSDGAVSILTGADDPYSEYAVAWLDNTHITYRLQGGWVAGHEQEDAGEPTYNHILLDLATGESAVVPDSLLLSQSPDGRYWVTCYHWYVYEGPCEYKLHDLATQEVWEIGESIGWGDFLSWSPDSQQMQFSAFDDPNDFTTQLVLISATSREEHTVTSNEVTMTSASWSPDGQTIALSQCSTDEESSWMRSNCGLWLMDNNGANAQRVPVQLPEEAWHLDWTPNAERLTFITDYGGPRGGVVWSVRLDGTDLRPLISNVRSYSVLKRR